MKGSQRNRCKCELLQYKAITKTWVETWARRRISKEFSSCACAGISLKTGYFISRERLGLGFFYATLFSALLVNWGAQPEPRHMPNADVSTQRGSSDGPEPGKHSTKKAHLILAGWSLEKRLTTERAVYCSVPGECWSKAKGSQAPIKNLPFHSTESRSAVNQRKLGLFQRRS